jgi:two-component system response regulator HydG
MADDVRIAVLRLSDSFSEVWPLLAAEAGAVIGDWAPPAPPPNGTALLLVAAGGREAEAADMLAEGAAPPDVPIVVVGADPSYRLAIRLVVLGVRDYVVLPADRDTLRETIGAAVATHRAAAGRAGLAALEAQAHAFREIIGQSAALRAVLERAARLIPHADATVLISGETGTGKELLARALHYGGPRAAAPFVELNCAALPPQLLESELFGHEKGAFTDAKTAKPGLFEIAAGGTLFLDEIHQLALELQSKILRAIEQKAVRRVGGTTVRQFDVRIVAATNTDLAGAVRAGRFREDLFYRLHVLTLDLPPLRARGDDPIVLAEAFLRRFAAQYGLPAPPLTSDLRAALLARPWPGNVRELRNTIERALLMSPPGTINLGELDAPGHVSPTAGPLPFPARLAEIQRAAARAMLDETGGNRSEAARRLGISRSRLQRLLEGVPDAGDDDPN